MHIVPMTRQEAYAGLFRYARPDTLIALGNLRARLKTTGDSATCAPLPLTASRPGTVSATADALQKAGVNPSYVRWNLFGLGLLQPDERGDVDASLRRRLERLREGGDPEHLFAQAYRLAELAALNVDLDVGTRKDGSKFVSADMALEAVHCMVARGSLPAPSMIGFSGQGLYILYALLEKEEEDEEADEEKDVTDAADQEDQDDDQEPLRPRPVLPDGGPGNRQKFKEAADGIIKRCLRVSRRFIPDGYPPTLNPDPSSKSPVQWFKNPDSQHPKTGETICYYRYAVDDQDKELRRYSLDDLLKWHPGIKKRPPSYKEKYLDSLFDDPKVKRRYTTRKGQMAIPMVRRMEDLERLAQHRGKIPEGRRSLWTLIVYNTCQDAAIRSTCQGDKERSRKVATQAAIDFSDRYFDPPLPKEDIVAHANRNRRDFKNQTLVRLLEVDYTEAVKAGLQYIVPDRLRAEIETRKKAEKKAESKTAKKAMRNQEMVDAFKAGKTTKAIAEEFGVSEGRAWVLKREFKQGGFLD